MTITTGVPVSPFLDERKDEDMRWFLGERTWVRAGSAQTGGVLGLVEQVLSPGASSPYHLHHAEDEQFYVLDGHIRFVSGDQTWTLGTGGFAFLPRGIPHGFQVAGDSPVHVLILSTPAGFADFVAELSAPEPPAGPPDLDHLTQVAGRYAIEILGPLPH